MEDLRPQVGVLRVPSTVETAVYYLYMMVFTVTVSVMFG